MQTLNLCILVAIHALVTIVISKLTNMSIQGIHFYMTTAISMSTVNLDVNYAITETCEVNTENEQRLSQRIVAWKMSTRI